MFTTPGPELACPIDFSTVIAMNSSIKIRPAPNGKVYVVRLGQPIGDTAGGLLYFDDEAEALEFMEGREPAELQDAFAS